MEDHETYRSVDTALSQARDAPAMQHPKSAFDTNCVSSVESPPNGGWEAWSQVLGGHIVTFFIWGFITSFGMFQAYYTATGVSSPSNISWIGSLMIFFLMLIPVWSGSAADVGHFKLVLRMGMLLWIVGIFTTSMCREYWQFLLAHGLCVGFANGLMFVPTMSVVSTYFDPSRRSLAIGLILCGSATGGMIFPIMLNRLFGAIGFGWAVRTFGFMALVLLVLAERLLKKRLPPKDSAKLFEPKELKDIVFVLFIIGSFLNFSGLYFAFFYVNAYARNELVVYGLFASALQGLFPATMADLTVDPKKTGTRFGMGFALSSFGVLTGSPVGGALIEYKHGDYLYAQVFAGSCGILGFLCVGLAAIIHDKKSK
ncbi:hypothetical protein G6514_001472 [Epicoccum nigrum]|nr:hypothetical protein G6514_001472 [Epicoccum nigrum]